jgi:hypothetical protein
MSTLRSSAIVFTVLTVLAAALAVLAAAAFDAHAQTWNIQVVDNTGSMGFQSRIAVTSDGTPYIMDTSSQNYNLFLRWWVPSGGGLGSWERIMVGDAYYGTTMGMVADSADRLHMAWENTVKDSMMYAVFDGTSKSWYRFKRGIVGAVQASVDLAIFEDEGVVTPTIAYARNGILYTATQDPVGETWSFDTVYDSGNVQYVSVATDSTGALHIAFYENAGLDLMYATNANGPWTVEYVDIGGNVGNYCSIVIETGNIPYIAYYDLTNTDLKYARLISE